MAWGPRPEPRVVLVDYLPARVPAIVQDDPPEIFVNRQHWQRLTAAERDALIAHECGHLDTATFQVPGWPLAPSTILRHEAQAERARLARLIPDEAVRAAIAQGCQTAYEFAEAWGVDEITARQRLAHYAGRGR